MVQWTFVELGEAESTQAVARGLASRGALEGTTVAAESQSSGVGRMGRSWASPAGGLYMSFILRPKKLIRPELTTLVSALGVAKGVDDGTGLSTEIRWPNDVMAGGKKLAGVIAEAETYGEGEPLLIIVGVGVNCNSRVTSPPFPTDATSIAKELKHPVDVRKVRASILDSVSDLYERWQEGEDMVRLCRARMGTTGRQVLVKLKTQETAFSTTATGIDLSGGLRVTRGGTTETIAAHDLDWLRELR